MPKTLDDLNLCGIFTQTVSGKRYLIKDEKVGQDKIVVFGSDTGIEILCKGKRNHADGTFDTAPLLFTQVYLIHACYHEKMFPCVIMLMTGKSCELYKRGIQIIKDQALELGMVWNPYGMQMILFLIVSYGIIMIIEVLVQIIILKAIIKV